MLQPEFGMVKTNNMRNSCWRSLVVRACSVVLLLAGAIVFAKNAQAQSYLTQIGVPPFTTALPVEQGFLNAANGDLHLQFELGSFPERGSRPLVAGLAYDSRIWDSSIGVWQPTNAGLQGGWRFFTTASPGTVSAFGNRQECSDRSGQFTIYTFTWTDSIGNQRGFTASTEYDPTGCDSNSPNDSGYATDASGFYMYVVNYTQATIYAPDGMQVYPSLKDTNGNFFSVDGNGNLIDPVGRTPVTVTSNCNGNSNQTCYNILNSQGSRSTYTVTTETISVNTAFGQSGVTEYSGSITVIQSIQLPDQTTYQFNYDSGATSGHYGLLTSMTLPTGGQVTYGYSNFQDSYGNQNRWLSSRVSGGGTWSYTPAVITICGTTCAQKVTVTKPSLDTMIYTFLLSNGAWKTSVLTYTGSGTLLSTVSNSWDLNHTTFVRLLSTNTTLPTPGGNNITSQTTLAYNDANTMNVASIKAWKFYAGTSPTFPATPDRETDFTYHAVFGNNITNRVTQATVKNSSGSVVAQTNFSYDDSGGLSNSTPSTGIFQHDDGSYGLSNTVRGNLTTIKRCTNLTNCSANYTQTSMTYDTTGQVLSTSDPNGHATSFTYTDTAFYNDAGDGPSNPPQSYTSSVHTNAYVKTVTPPLLPATTFGYYYGSGQRALATDANGQTTYSHFFDPYFSRPTSSVLPNGGWTYIAYSATETQVDAYTGITGSFATSACTGCRHDQTTLDNLGRLIHGYLDSDPEGQTTVDTTYDAAGRVQNTSHPYRSTSDTTYGLETPVYDGLNRVTKLTHPDTTFSQTLYGAAVSGTGVNTTQLCSSSTYGLGFPVLTIDEAGKKREVWTDGFGRTIEGDEPDSSGNLTSNTCYSYDALGNLLQVVRSSTPSQTRTYAYDALSRVTSVAIPELANCAVTYTYDSSSNLQTRVAPAPNQPSCTSKITTTYFYDSLNRLTKITYGATTPPTPTVQYGYDGNTPSGCTTAPPTLSDSNGKGRRTSMCDGSGATSWAHDASGRILTEKRTILGTSNVTQTISYTYNLDGSIATITYPSGKVITYTVSNAQRLTAANDVTNNIRFATAASYASPGALSGMITGQISGGFGGITESHNYNNSLEYTSTKATSTAGTALDLTLNYNTSGSDNGSVIGVTNNADNGRNLTLGYDPLNRISSATTQATSGADCWGQNFGPDALANLNSISSVQCNSNTLSVTVDANNHINVTSFAYDAAGNMTQDGKGTGYSYSFDAENRLVQATGMSGGPYCYVYDGLGLRVAKKSGANTDCSGGTFTKLYWRSLSGDSLGETDGTGSLTNTAYTEYVFFVGRRIASRVNSGNGNSLIFYYFTDQLGSTRTITTGSGKDSNGTNQTPGLLCYDADFTPYGQEISYTARLQNTACPPSYKFTGYERDPETAYGQGDTGLDYAFARNYSSRLGRFLSADPIGGSIGSLQSHNGYAYVVNNPMNFMDPTGLWCSGNIGNSGDTPCNPYNYGDGSGPQDPGQEFGDPLALGSAQYLASIPLYTLINGEIYLSTYVLTLPNPEYDPTDPASNAGLFQQVLIDLGPVPGIASGSGNSSGGFFNGIGGFFSGIKDKFLNFLAVNANYLPGVCTAGTFGFGTGGAGNASGGAEGGALLDKQIGKPTTVQPLGEVSYGPVGVGATPSEALVFVQPAPKVPVGAVYAADWHNGFINNSGISIGFFAGKAGHGKGLAGGFGGGAYLTFSSAANCVKNF